MKKPLIGIAAALMLAVAGCCGYAQHGPHGGPGGPHGVGGPACSKHAGGECACRQRKDCAKPDCPSTPDCPKPDCPSRPDCPQRRQAPEAAKPCPNCPQPPAK